MKLPELTPIEAMKFALYIKYFRNKKAANESQERHGANAKILVSKRGSKALVDKH